MCFGHGIRCSRRHAAFHSSGICLADRRKASLVRSSGRGSFIRVPGVVTGVFFFWPTDQTLIDAALKGDLESSRWSLRLGVNPNACTHWGWDRPRNRGETVLVIAAKGGDLALTRLLVEYVANVNLADGHRNYPILAASDSGNRELIEFLFARGADPKVRGPE
ncbi:MAG: ankyrin repeat domain-containing protein [Gemmataceae bacterium]|nr:ankyrin repeat domain-containing protein [Gemmataceae bacterium]